MKENLTQVSLAFGLDDERKKHTINSVLYSLLTNESKGTKFLVIGLVGFIIFALCWFGRLYIGYAILCFALILLAFYVLSLFLVTACKLKFYRLTKDMTVYTIDFREKRVVPVRFVNVVKVERYMIDSVFSCNILDSYDNVVVSEWVLSGSDIYFSYDVAKEVMDYVLIENEFALCQYFPQWQDDIAFVNYYKSRMPRYGFDTLEQLDFTTTAILNNFLVIGGITYKCCYTVEKLLQDFLNIVQMKHKEIEEQQKLRDAINEYQNNLQ